MIFAAMAAVLSSCSKNEIELVSTNDGKDIVLNISVSNPGADDTKALIKSAWAGGDEISIWYDTNNDTNPDLVIEYDAANTKWIQKQGAAVSGNTPSEGSGKYAKALYNGKVKVASKDNYTYDGTTLTFNIANWKFLTEVQVVVKNLTSASAGSYTLACDKFYPVTGDGYSVNTDGITASTGTRGAAVTGISNTDGVAFIFATADYSTATAAFNFRLIDNTSGSPDDKFYTATTDKISGTSGSMGAIKALTIVNTLFNSPNLPTGFKYLGTVANCKPVYWAEKNLGATNPQDYGTYFSWGETGVGRFATTSGSGAFSAKPFSWSNDAFGQTFGKVARTTACPSDVPASTYDAAYQTNVAWRMPTKEDFKELAKECFLEWTENYNSTGVKGVIVWKAKSGDAGWFKPSTSGKGRKIRDDGSAYNDAENHTFSNTYAIGTDPYVFFPAAGYGSDTNLDTAGSCGYYGSSSLYTSDTDRAYYLYLYSDGVFPQNIFIRYCGGSVRPVSD